MVLLEVLPDTLWVLPENLSDALRDLTKALPDVVWVLSEVGELVAEVEVLEPGRVGASLLRVIHHQLRLEKL